MAATDFYAVEDLLSAEERAIRDRVRDFCELEVTPVINDYWERAEFPRKLIEKIKKEKAKALEYGYKGC